VLSIPTAALVSKLLLPETETAGDAAIPAEDNTGRAGNPISALSAGAMDGLKLAAGIATLLIAVLGLVALIDLLLGLIDLDLGTLLAWLFTPLAWLLGIESGDLSEAAHLLGQRVVMTEVVAYRNLGELAAAGSLAPRTILVLSYALCGFAHLASVGIFIGGISALAPERREDLAALAWRALVGATLATLMTGALAGVFYFGQKGILGL
jgi:CNT family concentrative nucleoside transporter